MLPPKQTLLRICDMLEILRRDMKIVEPTIWTLLENCDVQPELQLGEQLFFKPEAVEVVRQAALKARRK